MIESQIAQLAAVVPPFDKGKILGQPEDLETRNLVDIHNAAYYYMEPSMGRWIDYTLPEKEERSRETCHPHRHWTSHFPRSYL